jgi:hypothetical protein
LTGISGFIPFDFLVLPRLLALVLMMPLLTIFADVVGILGGMGRFPRKPRRATGKHQAVDPALARKHCLDMLHFFPDHREAVDRMLEAGNGRV